MEGKNSNNQREKESELAEELERARRRVCELEDELSRLRAGSMASRVRREERRELRANIEFVGDFDRLRAQGVDISKGGLCLEVSEPLPFDMKLEIENQEHEYHGQMVWLKSVEDGGYRLGFRLVPPNLSPGP